MRMTNKIMQNNSLYNINATKIAEDKLTTQMTTQSKIDKPSDDPVVAIRALRLRTNVSETVQYHEKNAPDADQWLDVTAGALTTVTDILKDLYKQAEKAANKDLTSSDLEVILDQLKSYTKEFYATGNQDYAGRYIFTGYRTDTPLTFIKPDDQLQYTITERLSKDAMDSVSYTDYSKLKEVNPTPAPVEQHISNNEVARIRLAYNDLTAGQTPVLVVKDKDDNYLKDENGNDYDPTANPISITPYSSREQAYQAAAAAGPTDEKAFFIEETGELLLTKALADKISNTMEDDGTMSVTYQKNNWNVDDLMPQHFFECECQDLRTGKTIKYNDGGDVNTVINYDVGFNQRIQVNTNASEVFIHDLYRDVDDLSEAIAELSEVEKLQKEYKEEMEKYPEGDPGYEKAKNALDAANKAHTYVRERVQDMMAGQMTKYQDYLDTTNLAITQNGTRSSRLNMISSRLLDQKTIYRELQEDNEGIDVAETAVNLASAKMTYDAALQATSKILQNSLMNYI